MRRFVSILLVYCLMFVPLAGIIRVFSRALAAGELWRKMIPPTSFFRSEQLDNLLAPIALYPDPLLAQVLLAATFVDQVQDAAAFLRANNPPDAIDEPIMGRGR